MKKERKFFRASFAKVRKVSIYIVLIVAFFSLGYFAGFRGYKVATSNKRILISRTNPTGINVNFSLFWNVWDILEKNYLDKEKINYPKMVYGAIEGMVASLGDPYTAFLSPSDNKVVEEDLSGAFEGVGIQLGYRGTQLAVIAPLPETPAEKAGVKAGDFIIGIKDEVKNVDTGTVGMGLDEAVKIIRGPKGTKVTLLLLRDGNAEAIKVDLVREKVDVPSVILSYPEGSDVVHIKLLKFGGETDNEWDKAVSEIELKEGIKGIVLDLRGNPGGYLEGAVDVASDFVENNSIVVIEERSDKTRNNYRSEKIGKLKNFPLVVLVNGGSASASEILAGALRDIKKISIVGEKSFGKGTIQEPVSLEGGSSLHITIAKWLTPSEYWVNEKGLTPDIEIEDNEETVEDEQLLKAIEVLNL